MAVGMAVPLVIVYPIYKLHLGSEPQPPGMLDQGERQLIEQVQDQQKELPSPALSLPKEPALRLPEETTETKEADQD